MHAKDKALTRSTILGKTDKGLSADPTVYTVLSFGLVKAREKGSYLEGSRDRTGEVGTYILEDPQLLQYTYIQYKAKDSGKYL